MRLNYTKGSYSLSFFNIVIETDEELSKAVIEKNKSTFVHEFIHYLQDLILPYNIRLNLSNVRWFFNILESAHRHGRIIRPFDEWSGESRILTTQFQRSIGGDTEDADGRFVDYVSRIGDVKRDFVMISGFDANLGKTREHRVYQYFLPVYKVGDADSVVYHLGARDILEYIAYKIERRHFPGRPQAPQLPYETIDFIFEKYQLSQVPDDVRLCIAERCLYNDTPVHFLFTLLDAPEFRRFITASDYEEIYAYLLSLDTVTRDGHRESLCDKTQRRLKQFADELQLQYNSFGEIEEWILKIGSFVKRELYGRFIFSDLYRMDDNAFYQFIDATIRCIGIPMILNSKKECIQIRPDGFEGSQFVQFYTMQEFVAFAGSESKEKECPICGFCKANNGPYNGNCTLNPQGIIRGNKGCFYAEFLEAYGLCDIKFY